MKPSSEKSQNEEAILGVVIGDALDETGEHLLQAGSTPSSHFRACGFLQKVLCHHSYSLGQV